jgi:hypothetical protein
MKAIASLSLIVLMASPSFARVGETPDECAIRYGSSTGNLAKGQATFRRGGVTIVVHFENGKSVREDFGPESGGMLSDDQINSLLQESAEGSSWDKAGETSTVISYVRKDGQASAAGRKPERPRQRPNKADRHRRRAHHQSDLIDLHREKALTRQSPLTPFRAEMALPG